MIPHSQDNLDPLVDVLPQERQRVASPPSDDYAAMCKAVNALADAANKVSLETGIAQPFLGVFRTHAAAILKARAVQ